MIRRAFGIFLSVIILSAILAASDIWKVKPVRAWSREETLRLLRDSPWVRRLAVGGSMMDLHPLEGAAQTAEGRGEESSAAGRIQPTETGADRRAETATTTYYIEWSSAKIVRRANLHLGAIEGRAQDETAAPPDLPFHIISVGGPDLKAFAGATEAQLKSAAYLRPKRAKRKIEPGEVKIRKSAEDRITAVQFAFPREEAGRPVISAEEKFVEFYCRFGDLTLRVNFALAKMMTEEGRDL